MDKPFERLRMVSYRLAWLERFVCLTSGLSLSCAILIAGGSTTFLGRTIPGLGILQLFWVLFTILAVDTQLWAAIGASRDALLGRRFGAAAAWFAVLAFLLPPAFLVNFIFGLAVGGIAQTESQAVHMLHISPVLWIAQRCFYGVVLMIISGYTRPWAEQKVAEQTTVPAPPVSIKSKRKSTRKTGTSVSGRKKRAEVAMTLWREAQADRLYRESPTISIRELARQLTWTDEATGRAYLCSPETAGRILRPLRAGSEAAA